VTLTDPNTGEVGTYCFDDLTVREYYTEIILPDTRALSEGNVGNDDTEDSDATGANGFGTTDLFDTESGIKNADVDFGIYTGAIFCGVIWMEDVAGTENIYDEGIDQPIVNSQVEIVTTDTDEVILAGSTDDEGRYCINSIPVGSYNVRFRVSADGESFVQPNQGDDPLLDSDVDITTGLTEAIFGNPADSIVGINAGLRLGALPIELVSFDGYWDENGQKNVLYWATASEINNDFFSIERAVEASEAFAEIGIVSGSGTSNEFEEYEYDDTTISESGTYYYRLRQVDFDGGFEYSDIIAIDAIVNNNENVVVYPNPAGSEVFLDMMSLETGKIEVSIVDFLGRTISPSSQYNLSRGFNTIRIDTESWANGMYLAQIKRGSNVENKIIQIAR
jgi:hypothetical protein